MSVKLHNLGEYVVVLKAAGVQITNSGVAVAVSEPLPFSGQIKAVWGFLNTAGVTGSQTTDLLKNAATLLSSGALLTFATGVTTPTYLDANLSTNPTAVAQGDILSLTNTAIHSGTAAKDLVVAVVIQRRKGTGAVGAMITGTYGNDVV